MSKLKKVMLIFPPGIGMKGGQVRLGTYQGALSIFSVLAEGLYKGQEDKLSFLNVVSASLSRTGKLIRKLIVGGPHDFHLYGLSEKEIRAEIKETGAEVVMIPSLFTCEFPGVLEVASIAHSAGAKVIIGGHHATGDYEWILDNCPEIDFAVLGEGLVAVEKLLESGLDPRGVPGVAYRSAQGVVTQGFGERAEELPIPAFHLLDPREFPTSLSHWSEPVYPGGFFDLVAALGCSGACPYCTSPFMHTKKPRLLSLEQVEQILRTMKEKGFTMVSEMSDDLGYMYKLFPDYVKKLFSLFKEFGHWVTDSGEYAFSLTEDYVRVYAEAGCKKLQLSYEDPDILAMMREGNKYPIKDFELFMEDALKSDLVSEDIKVRFRFTLEEIGKVRERFEGIDRYQPSHPKYLEFAQEVDRKVNLTELFFDVLLVVGGYFDHFNVSLHLGTMIGAPGHTAADLGRTISFAERIAGALDVQNVFFPFKPFPGSVLTSRHGKKVYPEYKWAEQETLAGALGAFPAYSLPYTVLGIDGLERIEYEGMIDLANERINPGRPRNLGIVDHSSETVDLPTISIEQFAQRIENRRSDIQ